MGDFKGFFQLQTPKDLLGKMERDHARMRAAPLDPDAAFDFFVTAEHMLDWVYPDGSTMAGQRRDNEAKQRRDDERRDHLELAICSHIANGAKHFKTRAAHHQSVQGVQPRPAKAYGEGAYGAGPYGGRAGLEIRLREAEAQALGLRDSIDALELAERVLDHWRNHPRLR